MDAKVYDEAELELLSLHYEEMIEDEIRSFFDELFLIEESAVPPIEECPF